MRSPSSIFRIPGQRADMRRTGGVVRALTAAILAIGCLPTTMSRAESETRSAANTGTVVPAAAHRRAAAFQVPPKLRPRVEFWKDIFAKYGRRQMVVHHRMYPQIVFGILDFTEDAARLGPGELRRVQDDVTARKTAELENAIKWLASGAKPRNALERHIERQMSYIKGGPEKYQRILDEDLIRTQTGIRERFGEAVQRSGRYLPIMEQIFRDQGLPIELTRLPFVESSFDYTAYSSVGAAGIWQFMPATGRLYMRVTKTIDERRDAVEATKAAAQYLGDAYRRLNSWPLAVTSYNHGVAGVANKVRQLGTADIGTIVEHPTQRVLGFASNNFYASFLAALEVYEQRAVLFPDVTPEPPITYAAWRITQPIGIRAIMKQLNVSEEELRKRNYALSEQIWQGRVNLPTGYVLKIPPRGARSGANVALSIAAEEKVTAPSDAAPDLRRAASRTEVRHSAPEKREEPRSVKQVRQPAVSTPAGKNASAKVTLKAPASTGAKKSATMARPLPPPRGPTHHTVKRGDTLSAIADRYDVTVARLKQANNLKSNTLKPGQKLRVP